MSNICPNKHMWTGVDFRRRPCALLALNGGAPAGVRPRASDTAIPQWTATLLARRAVPASPWARSTGSPRFSFATCKRIGRSYHALEVDLSVLLPHDLQNVFAVARIDTRG